MHCSHLLITSLLPEGICDFVVLLRLYHECPDQDYDNTGVSFSDAF